MADNVQNNSNKSNSGGNSRLSSRFDKLSRLNGLLGSRTVGGSRTGLVTGLQEGSTAYKERLRGVYNNPRYGGGGSRIGGANRSSKTNNSSIGNIKARYIAMFDKDGDGVVSDQEVMQYLLRMRELKVPHSSRIFHVNDNAQQLAKALQYFDTSFDGKISHEEAIEAYMKIRSDEIDDIRPDIVETILGLNEDLEEIKALVNRVDSHADGKVTTLEVLDTLAGIAAGKLDGGDKNLIKLLGYNRNIQRIKDLVEGANPTLQGSVSDSDVMNILLAIRSGNVTDAVAEKILHINSNVNAKAIDASLSIFDKNENGVILEEEFITAFLEANAGVHDAFDLGPIMNALKTDEKFSKLSLLMEKLDANASGEVSQSEVIDFVLAKFQGEIDVDDVLLEKLLATNEDSQALLNLIKQVDTDSSGGLDKKEVVKALMAYDQGKLNPTLYEGLMFLLAKNDKRDEIITTLNFIDTDDDGFVSDAELVKTKVAERRGALTDLDAELVDLVLSENSNGDAYEALLTLFDPDKNGYSNEVDIAAATLTMRATLAADDPAFQMQGLVLAELDAENQVNASINIFDENQNGSIEDREFAAAYMSIKKGNLDISDELFEFYKSQNTHADIIQFAIDTMDADDSGVVSAQEFIDNFNAAVATNGKPDLSKMAVIAQLMDIIYPDAEAMEKFIADLDGNKDKILSDNELIDGLLALKKGTITDPGADIVKAVIAANENSQEILNLVNRIDLSGDGLVSDFEFFTTVVDLRIGGLDDFNPSFVSRILSYNGNATELRDIINIFDPDKNGDLSDVEYLTTMLGSRNGAVDKVNNDLFSLVAAGFDSSGDLTEILNAFDEDGDGVLSDRNFTTGFLASHRAELNIGQSSLNYLKSLNDHSQVIADAVTILDSNNNGQVDADEFLNNFTKAVSTDGKVDLQKMAIIAPLMDLIFPGGEALEQFLKDIDVNSDNVLVDDELINGLLAMRAGDINNPGLDIVRAVISANENFEDILAAVDLVDANADGIIDDKDVVDAKLALRAASVPAAQIPYLNILTSKNPNEDQIENIVELFDSYDGGDITRLELFAANFKLRSGEASVQSQFEPLLDYIAKKADAKDRAAVAQMIAALDPSGDGLVSQSELVEALLAVNVGDNPNPSDEMIRHLSIDSIDNKYSQAAVDAVRALIIGLDLDKDGAVTNTELAKYALLLDSDSGLYANLNNLGLLSAIKDTQTNATEIIDLVNQINLDGDTSISDAEVANALNLYRTGQMQVSDEAILDSILFLNSKYATIKTIYSKIDKNGDGTIADDDVAEAIFAYKDTELAAEFKSNDSDKNDAAFMDILETVLDTNANHQNIIDQFDAMAKTYDGNLHMLQNTLLEMRAGETVVDGNELLLNAMSDRLDAWSSELRGHYASDLGNFNSSIGVSKNKESAANDFGLKGDDLETANALIEELLELKTNLLDGKISSYNQIETMLADFDAKVQALPGASAGVLAVAFYETSQNLISDMVEFLGSNNASDFDKDYSKFATVKEIIALSDSDADGKFEDTEAVNAYIKLKKNEYAAYDDDLLASIFATNTNFGKIKTVVDIVDSSDEGVFSDTELVDSIFNFTDDALSSLYQSNREEKNDDEFMRLLDLVRATDPDASALQGLFDQVAEDSGASLPRMMNTLLAVRSGDINAPQYLPLVNAMSDRLDDWQHNSGAYYGQALNNFVDNLTTAKDKLSAPAGFGASQAQLVLMNEIQTKMEALKEGVVAENPDIYNQMEDFINDLSTKLVDLPGASSGPLAKAFYDDVIAFTKDLVEYTVHRNLDLDDKGDITSMDVFTMVNKLRAGNNFIAKDDALYDSEFDVDFDGDIDDDDGQALIDYINQHGGSFRFSSHPDFDKVQELISLYDKNSSANLEMPEAVKMFFDRKQGSLNAFSDSQVAALMGLAPGSALFDTVYQSFDLDGDDSISNKEILDVIMKYKDSVLDSQYRVSAEHENNPAFMAALDAFIDYIPGAEDMLNSFEGLADEHQGNFDLMKNNLLEIQFQNQNSSPYYKLIAPMAEDLYLHGGLERKASSLVARTLRDKITADAQGGYTGLTDEMQAVMARMTEIADQITPILRNSDPAAYNLIKEFNDLYMSVDLPGPGVVPQMVDFYNKIKVASNNMALYMSYGKNDVNGDGEINDGDMSNFQQFMNNYGSGIKYGDPNFDPDFDIDGNGIIDARDMALLNSYLEMSNRHPDQYPRTLP